MKPITIIGIGSPHGTDQIGWQAIESLKNDRALKTLTGDAIKILSLDRPGMALLTYLDGADYVIIIDAVEGGAAGRIIELQMNDLLNHSINLSSHNAGVAEALAMGSALNTLPDKLDIIGVDVGDVATNDSQELLNFKQLKQLVFSHIQSYLNL